MSLTGTLGIGGKLSAKKIKNSASPTLKWRLQNELRWTHVYGRLGHFFARRLTKVFGIPTMISQLRAIHIDGQTGKVTDYGIVSRRVVTTAFVNFAVDNMVAETTEWGDFKFHDSGIGVTGPVVGDTDIETTDGESRVTGTQLEGASANIYKTVGTITYTTTKAITEHGVFSIVTGGTLLDRDTFTAINVVNTDQIEFTYELTLTAGS